MSAPGFDDFAKSLLGQIASSFGASYEEVSRDYSRMHRSMFRDAFRQVLIKQMLGEWVSGLEPEIAMDADGRIIGLTIADMPIGSAGFIVISAEGRLG